MSARRKLRGNGSDAATHTTPPAANADEILTPIEAARFLRVSVRTLADWRLNNTGPAFVRLGIGPRSNVRYLRRTLLGFAVAHEQTTTTSDGPPPSQ